MMTTAMMRLGFGTALSILLVGSAAATKVEICHKGRTIDVALASLPAHEAHGDVGCGCDVIAACLDAGGILDEETCQCAAPPAQDLLGALCYCFQSGAIVPHHVGCVTSDVCAIGFFFECMSFCADLGYGVIASACDPALCLD